MDLSFVRGGAPKAPFMKIFILAGFAAGLLTSPGALAQTAASGAAANAAGDATRLLPGDWMPDALQADRYILADWEARKLAPPPPGYRWVRDDASGQFLMASMRTGRIADAANQARAPNPADTPEPPAALSAGDRLSGGDLDARFTVAGWRVAGLPAPARGYHWVNIRGRYLLTSIRTGMVRQVAPDPSR